MSEQRKTIAVDLDATLAQYDGWKGEDHIGDPIPGAQEFVKALMEIGDVVIHTTRVRTKTGATELAKDRINGWLAIHKFPDDVTVWIGRGKPIASAYIDDRAIECRPQDEDTDAEAEYELAVSKAKWLVEN